MSTFPTLDSGDIRRHPRPHACRSLEQSAKVIKQLSGQPAAKDDDNLLQVRSELSQVKKRVKELEEELRDAENVSAEKEKELVEANGWIIAYEKG